MPLPLIAGTALAMFGGMLYNTQVDWAEPETVKPQGGAVTPKTAVDRELAQRDLPMVGSFLATKDTDIKGNELPADNPFSVDSIYHAYYDGTTMDRSNWDMMPYTRQRKLPHNLEEDTDRTLPGHLFKPPKRETPFSTFFGEVLPENNVHGMAPVYPLAHDRVSKYMSKNTTGGGQLNNVSPFTPRDGNPDLPLDYMGSANGAFNQERDPEGDYWRPEWRMDTRKNTTQMYWLPGVPKSHVQGNPIGFDYMEDNRYSDVAEFRRGAMPTKATGGPVSYAVETTTVNLKNPKRVPEFGYTGGSNATYGPNLRPADITDEQGSGLKRTQKEEVQRVHEHLWNPISTMTYSMNYSPDWKDSVEMHKKGAQVIREPDESVLLPWLTQWQRPKYEWTGK